MVRVAGLKRRIVTGLAVPTNVGRAPLDVLSDVSHKAHELQERHAAVYQELVKPTLAEAGIRVVSWAELGERETAHLRTYFSGQIFPVLMPLAVDPAHPFPYISGLSLNLSVRVRNSRTGRQEFARVKVPQMLPRFVRVDPDESIEDARYVTLEELIANHLGDLFPGMEIVEHHVFRVTRNEDVEIEEDETENLIKALEKELLRRRFGPPIRLEITDDMDDVTLGLLVRELDVTEQEVFRLPGAARPRRPLRPRPPRPARAALPHARADHGTAAAALGVEPAAPTSSRRSPARTCCCTTPTSRSRPACRRSSSRPPPTPTSSRSSRPSTAPRATARSSRRSSTRRSRASRCSPSSRSRRDSTSRPTSRGRASSRRPACTWSTGSWASRPTASSPSSSARRRAGSATTATSARATTTRRRAASTRTSGCSRPTTRSARTSPASSTSSRATPSRRSSSASSSHPLHLRKGLLKLIAGEVRNAELGRPAGIRIKVNSIVDEAIIDALYRASNAGVPVEVWVRGICSLRPGIPGLSENIRVRSILGRYLEHSRIFSFENDGDPQVYIGSRGHDAPQPRSPHRGARAPHRPRPHRRDRLRSSTRPWTSARARGGSTASGEWIRHSVDDAGHPLDDMQSRRMQQIGQRTRPGKRR